MRYLITLTALLLLITAFGDLHVQYVFYQVLRRFVTITAIIGALNNKGTPLFVSFCIIAIIFNPIVPFYMNKSTWRVVDGISSIAFIIYALKEWKIYKCGMIKGRNTLIACFFLLLL